jgi:oxygen-independent coproporphyrinogen III oxidase
MEVSADLIRRYDRPGPRYTSFPPATRFHDGVGGEEYAEHLERASRMEAPLSFYAHLPFCENRCRYCGCNVVVTQEREVVERYLGLLHREIRDVASRLGSRRSLLQYHLGGGTPTQLSVEQLRALHGVIATEFEVMPGAEVAIEIDPRVTSGEQLEALREMGFNRLSLGVQDFTLEVQQAVNRVQPFEMTRDQVERARALGFDSINVDLIYGLPFQKPVTFCLNLERLLEIRPERIALYSFAYVPWLKPHQRALEEKSLPSPETKAELFACAVQELSDAGYVSIGMDHFALPDDEMAIAVERGVLWRNFMGYTVNRAPDQVACGMSGISDVAGGYFQNAKSLADYERIVEAGGLPVERGFLLTPDDVIRRHVITSLMCNNRLRISEIEDRFGLAFWKRFAPEREALAPLIDDGFVEISSDAIDVVGLGRRFIRNVCMVFDPALTDDPEKPSFSRTV